MKTGNSFEDGHRAGYRKGEYERVALATANSDLRSMLREQRKELIEQREELDVLRAAVGVS